MIKKLIDANVVLRFLLKDEEQLYKRSVEIILGAEKGKYKLILESLTVGEVVWVLKSVYKLGRKDISQAVLELLREKYFLSDDKKRILKSLVHFGSLSLSFADCWLLAGKNQTGLEIITFDKKLGKIR